MNNYNPKIHHRKSIRLKGYDYSQAGLYFITICCYNRKCLFGEIVGVQNFEPNNNNTKPNVGANNYSPNEIFPQRMILNDTGKIANEYWLEIPNHFPNAILHQHIIMPNHVHEIIELISDTNVGVQNFEPNNNGTGELNSPQPISYYIINNPAPWSNDKFYIA